jgi:5'-3' exonuclease
MGETMLCLIDGDIITYAIPFSMQDGGGNLKYPEEELPMRIDMFIGQILSDVFEAFGVPEVDYKVFITGKGNFREKLATIQPYKGNRDKSKRPLLYKKARDYLIEHHFADVSNGVEADDRIAESAFFCRKAGIPYVVCSIDKDMYQIPGLHYRWEIRRKDVVYHARFIKISEQEALKNFYKQVLTGDKDDNIPGIKGIGKKKSEKLLENCTTEEEMYQVCLEQWEKYIEKYELPYNPKEAVEEVAKLLYLKRHKLDEWRAPDEKAEYSGELVSYN